MAKPATTRSRLICEGCDKATEWHVHDVGEAPAKLKAAILKKAGWKDDCPACERDKKAKRK